MIDARADFITRKNEIDKYFQFLNNLDIPSCQIQYTKFNNEYVVEDIDPDLLKVLKANGFLLLYNLIESTISNSIQAIFNDIIDREMTFRQLSDNIKKLWLNNKQKSLKGILDVNFNKIQEIMHDVANSILTNQIAELEIACVNISGNLDAQEIRQIAQKFGFDESADGRDLLTIKTKRNHLAHGVYSFSEIGKDYSVQDFTIFKDKAFLYLEDVMRNIENYISEKRYENMGVAI
jgi:MAE_28990/MAE_18760-like HEPN